MDMYNFKPEVRHNFSIHIHSLMSTHAYKKMNRLERKFVLNVSRFLRESEWPTIQPEHLLRTKNLWVKYVNSPSIPVTGGGYLG